jgi:hypothetical protein
VPGQHATCRQGRPGILIAMLYRQRLEYQKLNFEDVEINLKVLVDD